VVAVFLGWLLASEPLTIRVVVASVAILAAIVLIRKGEQKTEAKHPEKISEQTALAASRECA
jgi:drug/metabolite transporter (DMT)-like permease